MDAIDTWLEAVDRVIGEFRPQRPREASDEVEAIYLQCRDLIDDGRTLAYALLDITPDTENDLASVRQSLEVFNQQLDVLEIDLNRLYEYRAGDAEGAKGRSFQVQADYFAVAASTERVSLATSLVGSVRDRLKGVRDAVSDSVAGARDTLTGAGQQAGAAVTGAVGGVLSNLPAWLTGWIKQLGATLLQLIGKLLTPKEWSISGQAGTNLLVFTGAVTLEITFG